MKKFLFITLSLLVVVKSAWAISVPVDSLDKLVASAHSDTDKSNLLAKLAYQNLYSKPEYSFYLSQRGLQIAKNVNYLLGQAKCYKGIGDALELLGNYPTALNAYLKSLHIAEQLGQPLLIAKAHTNIGLIYQDQGEYELAVKYTQLAQKQLESIRDKKSVEKYDENYDAVMLNLGYYYLELNKLDVALDYEQKAYTLAVSNHIDYNMGNILQNLGLIQEKLKNNALALSYYKMSVQKSQQFSDSSTEADSYVIMAKYFQKTGHADSAVIFAKKALQAARATLYIKGVLNSSSLLASLYETTDKSAAFDYYKIATDARDTLFNEEKVKEIQNLKFEEQIRQQEIAELKAQQDEERKDNLQLAGIALFIPMFFLLCLLLSNTKVNKRVIEFTSVLSLLFLFEFMTLLIHPFVEHFTNHTPVVEFLLFVCVAAFMAPAHHRLTDWLKEKLLHRHHLHSHAATEPKTYTD